MKTFPCLYCNKTFESKKYDKNRTPKYCSQECYGKSIRKNKVCPICKSHVKWCNKTYCSKKCFTISQTGKNLSEEHKKKLSEVKKGKKIKHLYTPEIIEKIRKALTGKPQLLNRGEKHPNYIDGGKEKWERQKAMGRVEYKEWRRNVFKRDDYTCQECKQRGKRINADHIKPWAMFPDLRYELKNGRTLCVSCHRKTPTWGGRTKLKTQTS